MSWYNDDDDERRKRRRGGSNYVGVSPYEGAVDQGYGPQLSERSEQTGAPYSGGRQIRAEELLSQGDQLEMTERPIPPVADVPREQSGLFEPPGPRRAAPPVMRADLPFPDYVSGAPATAATVEAFVDKKQVHRREDFEPTLPPDPFEFQPIEAQLGEGRRDPGAQGAKKPSYGPVKGGKAAKPFAFRPWEWPHKPGWGPRPRSEEPIEPKIEPNGA